VALAQPLLVRAENQRQVRKLRERRAEIISSNIFNAATPNYKSRDLDVESALSFRQRLPLSATSILHMANSEQDADDAAYRLPTKNSLDGNTVDLAYEQAQFSKNALAYRATLSFLNARVNSVRRALRGE